MEKNKKSNEFNFNLIEAYMPPIKTEIVEEITIGEELQRAASDSPQLLALVQINDDGSIGRTWTYSQLYDDCVSLA